MPTHGLVDEPGDPVGQDAQQPDGPEQPESTRRSMNHYSLASTVPGLSNSSQGSRQESRSTRPSSWNGTSQELPGRRTSTKKQEVYNYRCCIQRPASSLRMLPEKPTNLGSRADEQRLPYVRASVKLRQPTSNRQKHSHAHASPQSRQVARCATTPCASLQDGWGWGPAAFGSAHTCAGT